MRIKAIRNPGILLIVILLALMTACNSSGDTATENIYSATVIEPENEIGVTISASLYGDALFAICHEDYELSAATMDLDGSNVNKWSLEGNMEISAVAAAGDGTIRAIENIAATDADTASDDFAASFVVHWIDSEGHVYASKELPAEQAESGATPGIAVDSEGNTFIGWNTGNGSTGTVTALSPDGETLFTLQSNQKIYGVAVTANDTPCALLNGSVIRTIDIDGGAWGSSQDLDGSYTAVYAGLKNTVYLDNGNDLYEYNIDTNTETGILKWTACSLSGSPIWLVALGQNRFIASTESNLYLVEEKSDDEETDDRIVLTLATESAAFVMNQVNIFNRINDDYRIEVTEYTAEDETKFLTEITAGNIPDIFCFSKDDEMMSSQILAANGALADLYTYIDGDTELDRNSFVPNILLAAEESDGGLYELPVTFWIDVVGGESSVVGEEIG